MKKTVSIFTFLIFTFTLSYGQLVTDTIVSIKGNNGYEYYQGDLLLTATQLDSVLYSNDIAYELMGSAHNLNNLGKVLGYIGGFLIGWPLGTAVGGGEPVWALAGVGAGILIVSIPINLKAKKKSKLAIDIYNRGLQTSSFWSKSELKFTMTNNGIGLTMKF